MRVRDIMTDSPACCKTDQSLAEVARMMLEHDCAAIPVIEGANNGNVIGIVTDRDIVIKTLAKDRNPLAMTAAALATVPDGGSSIDLARVSASRHCKWKAQNGRARLVPAEPSRASLRPRLSSPRSPTPLKHFRRI